MRSQWRCLLLRHQRLSRLHSSAPSSHLVVPNCFLRSLSSFSNIASRNNQINHDSHPIAANVLYPINLARNFSSEPAVDVKKLDHVIVKDVFSRLSDRDEIIKELDSNGIVVTPELGLKVLRGLESSPDVAKRFFDWISDTNGEKLNSKLYNSMLYALGINGLVEEFWGLVDAMKKKGHGVSARVRDKVGDKFLQDGLTSDFERLKGVFASGSVDNSVEKVDSRVCKIVLKEDWSSEVEKQLQEFKVEFSSDVVKMIVEKLDADPRKALLFFRWINESGLFRHDEKTYNAIASVLGREKFLDRFWNLIEEMKSSGFKMESKTYVRVSARLCQTKLVKEAVKLFELAMADSITPTPHCCTLILKSIVTAQKLDMDLFSRVVKAYTEHGNTLTDSMLNSILKSLRSVDRFGQSSEVLREMEKGGFVAGGDLRSKIALGLSRAGKKDEANEFENFMQTSGNDLDEKAMTSLVEGLCVNGELDKASECFKKMVANGGSSNAGYTLDKLVLSYCNNNRVKDAYKLFYQHVKEDGLKPWHSTYKVSVRNLLAKKIAVRGGFEEALSLLPLMKNHGFPPFVDPFLNYLPKAGTSDDAFAFLNATSNKFPSVSLTLRLFEAMLKVKRYNVARDLLAKCPGYIRSHPDVLELFNTMKPHNATPKPAVIA